MVDCPLDVDVVIVVCDRDDAEVQVLDPGSCKGGAEATECGERAKCAAEEMGPLSERKALGHGL